MRSIVISGSFRKHLDGIRETIVEFERAGINVLSPKNSLPLDPDAAFVLLRSDKTEDPETLERDHLNAIKKADALYVYNKDGYLGSSAIFEMGSANILDKPIFVKEEVKDPTLRLFCTVATPSEIAKALNKDFLISEKM